MRPLQKYRMRYFKPRHQTLDVRYYGTQTLQFAGYYWIARTLACNKKPYSCSAFIMLGMYILTAALLLSGCGSIKAGTQSPQHATKKQEKFQDWRLDGCHLINKNGSLTLRTDGTESHQTLRLALHLPHAPQNPPHISVLGVPSRDLELAGRRKNWSFELPKTTYATAQMMADKAYVVVEYTPQTTYKKPTPQRKSSVFSLKELPHALLALYKHCEDVDGGVVQ